MKTELTILKDRLGNNYIGLKFSTFELSNYLEKWYSSLEDKNHLNQLIENRFNRQGDSLHMTVVNVMDFNKLNISKKEYILDNVNISFEFEINGIGKAIDDKKGNETHFLVVNSPILQKLRNNVGLNNIDFHITLGFDKKDVFGVSKGNDSLFLKF